MSSAWHLVATLAIFAVTLALVVLRPRGWSEAWWTVLGALAMLGLGLVTPHEAWAATLAGKNALLFLVALLLLSMLVGRSGFFEWAAIQCARLAGGDAGALYRNTFLLGALTTAVMSLDATAVILTPVVFASVKRLRLPSEPYIVLCAVLANVASLLLPISNLTNILVADAIHLDFAAFAVRMILPQLVALLGLFALLRVWFRRSLPLRFADDELPAPASVVPSRRYFFACVAALVAVLIGYFLAPLVHVEAYVVALACCALLAVAAIADRRLEIRSFTRISWGVFPFVVGLFVVVRGVEALGVDRAAASWLASMSPGSFERAMACAGATAAASNLANNLPAVLVAKSALELAHAPPADALAALIGGDVGPLVTPFGSLATMLVVSLARREGETVSNARLLAFGAVAAPILVLLATAALWISSALGR